ncbi:MAG: hypothetical protein AAFN79_17030 [Pseudomonadota bacterium]
MQNRMMKTTLTCAALACAFTIVAASSAKAQQGGLCGQRDQIVSQLQSVHGESRQAVGLQQNARVMETYANPETGSWTIIVSTPTGVACLVAAGEAFQANAEIAAPAANLDDPA